MYESQTWQYKPSSRRWDILVIFGLSKLWTKLLWSKHDKSVLESSGGRISDVKLPGTLSSGVLRSISVHKYLLNIKSCWYIHKKALDESRHLAFTLLIDELSSYSLNFKLWLFWTWTWIHVRYAFLLHNTVQYTDYYRQLRPSRLILVWVTGWDLSTILAKANLSQHTDATAAAPGIRSEQKKVIIFLHSSILRLWEVRIRRGGIKITVEKILAI